MRIVFFSTLINASWGGSEVLWGNAAMHMLKEGHEVAAFVKQWEVEPAQISKLRSSGAQIFYSDKFKKNTFQKKVINKIKQSFAGDQLLLQKIFNWQPDFIFFSQGHSYDLGYYSDAQLQPLLATNVPFAIICQNNTDYSFVPENEVRSRVKLLYEKSDKVFFGSTRNKETAERIICEVIENAGIIANGLSLSPEEINTVFPENDEIQFASVARLRCSHKGQNLLLHVLSQQKWIVRSWKLNLYGTGEDEDYLKELTQFLKLEERIVFHGQMSNTQKLWQQNHIMLLASFGEGLPLTLQEAMFCGRPAMVTDVGGNAELIIDGVTGWLADGTTFKAVDDALERAWADRPRWAEMGEQARQKVMDIIDITPEITLSNYCFSIVNKKK